MAAHQKTLKAKGIDTMLAEARKNNGDLDREMRKGSGANTGGGGVS